MKESLELVLFSYSYYFLAGDFDFIIYNFSSFKFNGDFPYTLEKT
jgi:hypothetical protein